ncbi:hypothetical protein V3851_25370 [Paenibacillus sp. M1]|uniref:Uncharacterized protein n=1 Tax=Paenibacillus haidiansis TaxID=1574488 RepID=A0ABU7W0E7_9BACL
MNNEPLPDWLKPALDQRFIDLARIASKLEEVALLRQKQSEIERQLKRQLLYTQYKLFLEWEEALNFRHAVEKEWIYYAGLKDGIQLMHVLQASNS